MFPTTNFTEIYTILNCPAKLYLKLIGAKSEIVRKYSPPKVDIHKLGLEGESFVADGFKREIDFTKPKDVSISSTIGNISPTRPISPILLLEPSTGATAQDAVTSCPFLPQNELLFCLLKELLEIRKMTNIYQIQRLVIVLVLHIQSPIPQPPPK